MSSKRPIELGRDARLFLLFLSEINLVMGALFFAYPSLVIELWPWPVMALAVRFIGAIFLAIAFGCWSALRAKIWQRAKVLVLVGGTFFRIKTLIVGVFGIMMLLLPDVAQHQFWPWLVATPSLQMFSGLFLATCLATGWASLQTDMGRIRVLLPLDVIFPSLALLAVGIHWDVISIQSPSALVTGVWVFIYAFVAVGSAYLYFYSRKQ